MRKDLNKNGIDSIVSFDYMGVSEYEWGALNKALSKIRENFEDYIFKNITISGKDITVFVSIEHSQNIEEFLVKLSKNKIRLKGQSFFDYYIQDSERKASINFWWSIDYHFMFWASDEEFEKDFKEIIAPAIIKKTNFFNRLKEILKLNYR
jgi:hypothetical protein